MRPRTKPLVVPTDEEILAQDNVPVEMAARYLGSSNTTLYEALQDERVPFGWAVHRGGQWAYNISPGALVRYKREGLPMYKLREVQEIAAEGINRILDQRNDMLQKVFRMMLSDSSGM